MADTLDYYNKNAIDFINSTVSVDFKTIQDRFLEMLDPGSKILDFGCGSGRDTKYFIENGFDVDATDGSSELCRLASEYTKIDVRQMLFSELNEIDKYDGIWACSSILHLPKDELKDVFIKMAKALKNRGVLYTSFKYGAFEGVRHDRYFTDFTEDCFIEYISDVKELSIKEYWITEDVRKDRSEKWLNLILLKK